MNDLAIKTVRDAAAGIWRKDATAALLTRQRKAGHWQTDAAARTESNPELCTEYGC